MNRRKKGGRAESWEYLDPSVRRTEFSAEASQIRRLSRKKGGFCYEIRGPAENRRRSKKASSFHPPERDQSPPSAFSKPLKHEIKVHVPGSENFTPEMSTSGDGS
ncbi:hypothetical protein ACLOJK_025587 [Asimina triloba]